MGGGQNTIKEIETEAEIYGNKERNQNDCYKEDDY